MSRAVVTLHADARNDTLAVHLDLSVLLVAEGPDQLSRDGRENWWDFNPDYADTIETAAPAAPHLATPPKLILPDERWWDLLADLCCASRSTLPVGHHQRRRRTRRSRARLSWPGRPYARGRRTG
jgi:hypothetical protein